VLEDRRGVASGTQLTREDRDELTRTGNRQRARVAAAAAHIPSAADHGERTELALSFHPRLRIGRRTWIAWSTPSARKFVINDDPPTETKGSGMPVIGAAPIDMALFTKTWNRNMNAIAPATTAENRSRALVTIFRARHTIS